MYISQVGARSRRWSSWVVTCWWTVALNLTLSLSLLLLSLVTCLHCFFSHNSPFSLCLFSNSLHTHIYRSRSLSSYSFEFKILFVIVLSVKKQYAHSYETSILSHLYLNLLPLKKMLLLETVFIWLDFAHLREEETKGDADKETSLLQSTNTEQLILMAFCLWL